MWCVRIVGRSGAILSQNMLRSSSLSPSSSSSLLFRGTRSLSTQRPLLALKPIAIPTSSFLSQRYYSSGDDSFTIVVPPLGDSITEGTIEAWAKEIGEAVETDEIVGTIESDKVTQEVRSPQAGTIVEFLVEVGSSVRVGDEIARIGGAGAAPPPPSPSASSPPPPPPAAASSPSPPSPPPPPPAAEETHVRTPMIRFKYGLNATIAPSPPSPSSRAPSSSPIASPSAPSPPSGSVEGGSVVYRYESISDLPEKYHPRIIEDEEIDAILTGMKID